MKIIFSLLLLLFSTVANAQISALDKIFETYQEAQGVTSIKIGKPMFNVISKFNIQDDDLNQIRPLLTKINSIKMLIVEDGENNIIQNQVKNAFNNIHYEELISINSEKNKVKFLAQETEGDVLKNLLLNISTEGSTIFMILDGAISYADINKLVAEEN
ncbi:DUF4252 domain-containing protein [Sphingobacterium hungaricum]|uniref:DUF4252 domain-containing protein n=1 Tax=Sphingobacterium hungaricum TaxID=2082723 RepID=A0A928UWZ9_9SPHI|nr:DUF4252 domain-containing protein [Sphingobacterium hungaricum]MBE8712865.1 DUF4252 domain-containing protein [Sphingobacterium hungaricum]